MKNKWLAIQSFWRDQNLLNAINILSIHIKLQKEDLEDLENADSIVKARSIIEKFLENLENIINETNDIEHKPLVGIDPRFRQLTRTFIKSKKRTGRYKSDLFKKSPSKVINYIYSNDKNDQKMLLESLSELREFLEEHIYTDTENLIGEF